MRARLSARLRSCVPVRLRACGCALASLCLRNCACALARACAHASLHLRAYACVLALAHKRATQAQVRKRSCALRRKLLARLRLLRLCACVPKALLDSRASAFCAFFVVRARALACKPCALECTLARSCALSKGVRTCACALALARARFHAFACALALARLRLRLRACALALVFLTQQSACVLACD